MKHTPGPWKKVVRKDREAGTAFYVTRHDQANLAGLIATVTAPVDALDEAEGNACLIASAPDLLKIAKKMFSYLMQSGVFPRDAKIAQGILVDLAKAIARAEGE